MNKQMLEFVWACGVFEGEGTIDHGPRRGPGTRRCLTVGSTDADVLRRLHAAFGVGTVYGPYKRRSPDGRGLKDMWTWQCGRWANIEPLLTRMLPWLCGRRAEAARSLLADPAPPPGRPGKPVCGKGHPWSTTPAGHQYCRECGRVAMAARRARLKAS